ncbi:uncharacterized protein CLUP02_02447 [Colletotrichum lupini]|uniref:Uncharacterized protein n=1 Tax=Colletotrichum lupini TaxID=145971 RepID=A0A9Q8SGI4_9PEZI|nr:uncharacterized protein CLUP02_02447 [Colletotrichum lupini]UQC76981.1 hypothetical protein CLUP02_02447 [Colletotrichum lupini]
MGPGARDGVGLNKPEVCQEGYLFSAVAQWLIAHPKDFADVDTMSSIAKRWNPTMEMTRDILVGRAPELDPVVAHDVVEIADDMDVDVVSIPSTDNEAPEENRRESPGERDAVDGGFPYTSAMGPTERSAFRMASIINLGSFQHSGLPRQLDNQQSGPHDFLGAPRALLLDVLVLSCQPSRLKRSMKTISSAPRVPLVPPIGPDLTEDPNEGHFELLVDVSEEIDRNVPTGMAVSHAKELRNTQVRIIYNRRKTVVSLASPAPAYTGVPTKDDFDLPVAVSQEVDREALTSMAVSLAKTLRGMNVRIISNRKVIVSMADKAIKLSDVIFDSDRESALKANLLEAFKILNGGPRRPGQKNETVALKMLEKHLGISADDVRRIIEAAKLSWILASVWGRDSVPKSTESAVRTLWSTALASNNDIYDLEQTYRTAANNAQRALKRAGKEARSTPVIDSDNDEAAISSSRATSLSRNDAIIALLRTIRDEVRRSNNILAAVWSPRLRSVCHRLLRVCTFFPRFEGAKTVFRVT